MNRTLEEEKEHLEPLEVRVGLHPFFCGMARHHIKLLADCAMETQYGPGEYLFHEDEIANRFYVVESGRVQLQTCIDGQMVPVDEVGAGGLVGWSWLFPPHRWHFDAMARERTTVIFFYGTLLRDYCERDQMFGYELFKRLSFVMSTRLQKARQKLLANYYIARSVAA